MSSQLSRANNYERSFIQMIPIDPLLTDMADLIEMAKAILADAVILYATKRVGFYETYHLQNGNEDGPVIEIKPDTEGACVTQTTPLNKKSITAINFYTLGEAYLASLVDSDLLDKPITTKEWRCSYQMYWDRIPLPPLKPKYAPYVEIAKDAIAQAATHFARTRKNILTNTFTHRKEDSESYSLRVTKLENGVRVEQEHSVEDIDNLLIKSSSIIIEFDFNKIIFPRIIANDPEVVKNIDKIVAIPILDKCTEAITGIIEDIVVQASIHFYQTNQQLIHKKITICGENNRVERSFWLDCTLNNIGKIEINPEREGVQVSQFYTEMRDDKIVTQKCNSLYIDFNTLSILAGPFY